MQDKTVIITGAGFSAPAKVPIQNKILEEMIKPEDDFLDFGDTIEIDNPKFLDAFIRVGLYLLKTYTPVENDVINNLYNKFHIAQEIKFNKRYLDSLIEKADKIVDDEQKLFVNEFIKTESDYFGENPYFQIMAQLKGEVKHLLQQYNLKISLEDVFTTFDKAITLKKYTRNYNYHQTDLIQQAILRLFVYYFGKRLKEHSFKETGYLNFAEYVRKDVENISIITTNWDTLIEGYLKANSLSYDLCLNNRYYHYDDEAKNTVDTDNSSVKLIKLHGSINWFKCLHCGNTSMIENGNSGEYLLSESEEEQCICCSEVSKDNYPLLQPEIITPTMVKTYDNQLYKNLWAVAAERLKQAQKIIFIGYSFPMADFELKYLLQSNINDNVKIDVVLHESDNPQRLSSSTQNLSWLLPEERYKNSFAKNQCNFYYEGFEKYFELVDT